MTTINVNGESHKVDTDPNMPLLWVVRDLLGYTGTKFGCGKGLCGACTVLVDGSPMRACSIPVSAVQNTKVTTIEGLSANGDHPVQQAWKEENVPQCGYCQSGQIMSASALLAKNASPNDDEISEAMAGNICRCGTYPRIKKAIHRASKLMK